MNDDEAVRYGADAARVLESKAYQDAYRVIEEGIVNELAKSDLSKDRAEHLRLLLSLGRAYRKYLEKAMADGKFSVESMRLEEQKKKFWQRAA